MENSPSTVKRKSKSTSSKCEICGSSAMYSYYGVISCQACKTFFRRLARNKEVCSIIFDRMNFLVFEKKSLKCHFHGHCEVNINTRHVCAACRLSKCFKQGMKVEMIRNSSSQKSVERKANFVSNALVPFQSHRIEKVTNQYEKQTFGIHLNVFFIVSNDQSLGKR